MLHWPVSLLTELWLFWNVDRMRTIRWQEIQIKQKKRGYGDVTCVHLVKQWCMGNDSGQRQVERENLQAWQGHLYLPVPPPSIGPILVPATRNSTHCGHRHDEKKVGVSPRFSVPINHLDFAFHLLLPPSPAYASFLPVQNPRKLTFIRASASQVAEALDGK